ncbi:arginine deiminase type-3 [Cordyceps fumosorosea ARSEF 2679]|uniref:Arginine deiminase type-3 n=1 Tax=Cordyceps fumosorosea (strain ARSEF 2679) TaxID=1081104 RepID=A0A167DYD6_CORFA|nr:arginine deiminase type-3 [Cordyceps fumosorosea ARSEF 2679]OAA43047.1 arginine deiminase type-3 [Cordyceps fumosorosea ARSEF 2679]
MRFAPLIGVFTLSQAIPQAPPGTRSVATKRAGDLKVVLLADTNRDGKVDMTGDSDRVDKETWTAESGALFLANIADTNRRCSSQITGRCAADLGDIFRENFVAPPEPTIFGKSYKEWVKEVLKLKNSQDKKDQEEYEAQIKSPEYAAYARESVEWRWATGDGALIEMCHDASDNVVRNSALLAPLRTVPNPELSDAATGSITVSGEAAAFKVRIFHKKGGSWEYVGPDYAFSAGDIKAGLELGLDGRDVRRPNGWDGKALVKFTIRDGDSHATDSVALRVAPVLTHHHGQLAEQLFASNNGKAEQQQFVKDIEAVSNSAGMKSPVHTFDTKQCYFGKGTEGWTQDFFEPGYTSIPGPDGPVGLRIMIRSSQARRDAGRKLFQELRSGEVGVVQHLVNGFESGTVESMGNLETIPPYTHNGKAYPAGRTIIGSQTGKKPVMMAFLEAQEVQQPLQLDTSWLVVGHVDEFLQFLPAKSERKWVMVVDDPTAGLELLQKAQKAGHGAVKAVSRPSKPSDPAHRVCTPSDTIDQVLEKKDFVAFQDSSAQAIQKNIDLIKQDTGITDAEIIRLPALYYPGTGPYVHWRCEKKGSYWRRDLEARAEQSPPENAEMANILGELDAIPVSVDGATAPAQPQRRATSQVATLYPGTINGIVLSDSKVLSPNPWGPVIDGKDILAEATNAAYAKANFTVEYMDDWYTHHVSFGEVHCATNTLRETTGQWW